jgi:predicted restriction endonuclease
MWWYPSIPGYVKVTDSNQFQTFSQQLRERVEKDQIYTINDSDQLFATPRAFDLPEQQEVPRTLTQVYRIIRDTEIARRVKAINNYACQICGFVVDLGNGELYAEFHHIMPLGSRHNGPDIIENILCVCPTHHVLLDYGAIPINQEELRLVQGHVVKDEYINYHNTQIYNLIEG